jgi:hypothetical protein
VSTALNDVNLKVICWDVKCSDDGALRPELLGLGLRPSYGVLKTREHFSETECFLPKVRVERRLFC